MTIARLRAWITRTPFRVPVTWTIGGSEDAAVHLWLELTNEGGARGLSETPVKPAWTGVDGPTALAAVEHLLAPRLLGAAPGSATAALSGIRGLDLLRAATGHALADLAAPGVASEVPLAVVLTRAAPEAMAEAAARAVSEFGVTALKIKAGQGLDIDADALARVRGVLGDGGTLTVDANGAYGYEDGIALCHAAADHGALFVEDPWPLVPDQATGTAIAACACPVSADLRGADAGLVPGLIEQGVTWIAVKPNRIGPEAARGIAAAAARAGVKVVSGLFGEGPGGAVQQARGPSGDTAVEAAHYLELDNPVPVAGLSVSAGTIAAPPGRLSGLVSVDDIAARAVGTLEVAA
ncbi:hypothetical protein HKCCE2091_08850 [Rhodobacterales bacterium HKCCE2091]|nr:hypothetical protein [Rhodobacterales bacterium HKCCE2091]